eukprot:TRINITY_DN9418_c0_g2_i2.p1 TRINITY_DN9418_c0_g2~~TRINITY_DN9418_c0_g2_i2.p1  ORF type:complete len:259 (-),score=57.51 TRINITY_DN9418_c0_g2_i2:84-860(-)
MNTLSDCEKMEIEDSKTKPTSTWTNVVNTTKFLQSGSWYLTEQFEEVIKQFVGSEKIIDSSRDSDVRVCAVSSLVSVVPLETFVFRNYNLPLQNNVRHKGCCDIQTWKAVRATTCAPSYFDIFEEAGMFFRDGAMMANNPSGIALSEARGVWGNKNIDMVLSVGTGLAPVKEVKNADTYSHLLTQLGHSCCETEQTHQILETLLPSSVYFRLQPRGEEIFSMPLDETSPDKLELLMAATNRYIDNNIHIFQKICTTLV